MSSPTEADVQRILDRIATEVVERDLVAPAVMFLESVRPLAFIGGQLTIAFFSPFLGLLGNSGVEYADLLSDRKHVETLIRRIEEIAKEDEESRKEAKSAAKKISDVLRVQMRIVPGFTLTQCTETGGEGLLELQYASRDKSQITLRISIKNPIASTPLGDREANFSVSGHEVRVVGARDRPSSVVYMFDCPRTGRAFRIESVSSGDESHHARERKLVESMIRSIRCH